MSDATGAVPIKPKPPGMMSDYWRVEAQCPFCERVTPFREIAKDIAHE